MLRTRWVLVQVTLELAPAGAVTVHEGMEPRTVVGLDEVAELVREHHLEAGSGVLGEGAVYADGAL